MKTIRKAPPRKLGFLTVPASFLMALLLVAAPLERTQAQSGERPERTTPNFATQSQLERATELRTAGTAGLQEEIDTIQPSYQIGDRGPGGGTVFFTYDQGRHGLEVARQDLSYNIPWSDGEDRETRALRDGVNGGLQNSERIVLAQGRGDYAAWRAANFEFGGYGDWYLPSAEELYKLYQVQYVDRSLSPAYWSSTEVDREEAYVLYFFSGELRPVPKWGDFAARAIRRF